MPNTTYNVSVANRYDTCVGILYTRSITTLAVGEVVPQCEYSELIMIICMYTVCAYYCNMINHSNEKAGLLYRTDFNDLLFKHIVVYCSLSLVT